MTSPAQAPDQAPPPVFVLLMVGAFGDPQAEGSMAIFRTRQIRQWNEAYRDQR